MNAIHALLPVIKTGGNFKYVQKVGKSLGSIRVIQNNKLSLLNQIIRKMIKTSIYEIYEMKKLKKKMRKMCTKV